MSKTSKQKQDLPIKDSELFAALSNDMTGLIPSGVQDEAEVESYEALYPYQTKCKSDT